MALNIWMLCIGEPLPLGPVRENRTSLLSRALLARGHSVLWWTSAFDHFSKSWHFPEDTRVAVGDKWSLFALHGCGYQRNVSLRRFVDHRLIARKFAKLALEEPVPDLIIASLPAHDLAYEASRYATRHGVPLILDLRDQWPDLIIDALPSAVRWLGKIALYNDARMTALSVQDATSVTSMLPSVLEWGQQRGKRAPTPLDRVFYLGAEAAQATDAPDAPKLREIADLPKRPIVAFIGTFGRYYHPEILARVARRMADTDALFVLGGDGEFMPQVTEACRGLQNVITPGWMTNRDIGWLLARSTLGVIPCNIDADALPNKFFTYISGGVPIVSSLDGEARRLLEHEGLGRYYRTGDEQGLEAALRSLLSSPEELVAMGQRARAFFDANLRSDIIYGDFARHAEQVATLRNSAAK